MDYPNELIKLHSAGATVKHKSDFEHFTSYKNAEELSQDFIKIWALPFYTNIGKTGEDWSSQLILTKSKITKDIVLKLLGDFNWRTRQTGSFFATIMNFTDLIDIIGIHLLKSEVCYAGRFYAYALASFNTNKSVKYLDSYLTYYLTKTDLWFDQRDVMEALTYLDKINSTDRASKHFDNWIRFIANKPDWDKNITTERLEVQLALIEKVKRG